MRYFTLIFKLNFSLFFIFPAPTWAGANPPPDLDPVISVVQQADPLIAKAWHLANAGVFEAWKTTKGNPKTTIAVVDSGINYNHPEIAGNIRRKMSEWPATGTDKDSNGFPDDVIGWDFVKKMHLPWDRSGHGTFISTIIAGALDNGIGAAGVCPHCTLLPLRFINYQGLGDTEDAIRAIYYAIQERTPVINLSFCGEGYDKDLHRALEGTLESDAVVVVSAGNDGENIEKQPLYPPHFKLPNLITVAASDKKDGVLSSSNWGKTTVHLAAPGADILSLWFTKFETGSGTSDAAAVVSGAAGLIRSANPSLNAPTVVEIIKSTVRVLPNWETKVSTGGVLDVAAAMQCAMDATHPCLKRSFDL